MMDQVNFEATRPVSADPAVDAGVALAEALGQLPQEPLKAPAKVPSPKAKLEHKISVESLAQEQGLKLGDQNQLTIRRVKRGKSYSFIRANGTAIRHVGTIKRLHSMAVPPAYRDVRYSPDPTSHLQAVGTRCGRPAAIPLSRRLGKGPRAPQGAPPGAAGGGVAEDPP